MSLCGLPSSRLGFLRRLVLSMEPPSLNLMGGGGGISPCLILWRGTCPGWLSPPNGDPGST
jgi:hypothetical protein